MNRGAGSLLALVLALMGCAHTGGTSHAGRDATAGGARHLGVTWREDAEGEPPTRIHDIVTARGGDPIDWYVFKNDYGCRSLAVALAMDPARPRSDVAITLVKPDGEVESKRVHQARTRNDRDARLWFRRDPNALVRAIRVENAKVGHYYVGVQTIGDSAATYRLLVHDASDGFECGDLPPPSPRFIAKAPASATLPTAPPGAIAAPIAAWFDYDDGHGMEYMAEIAAGFDDGVNTAMAQALDQNGQPLPGIQLRVQAYDRHHARAWLVRTASAPPPSWAVAIPRQPLPPPPLTVHVTDRWTHKGVVFVAFDRGSIDGIAVGWRGSFYEGRTLEVTEVHGIEGVARLDGTSLDAVLGLTELQLAPP